jgi:hypothetical protein
MTTEQRKKKLTLSHPVQAAKPKHLAAPQRK